MNRLNLIVTGLFITAIMFAGCEKKVEDEDKYVVIENSLEQGVYLVGYEDKDGHSTAKMWKRGEAKKLADGTNVSWARSVYVSGNDVYAAGIEISPNGRIATLWKNGTAQNLTDGTYDAEAMSVFVSGNDVYVVGGFGDYNYGNYAMLWINGEPQLVDNKEQYPDGFRWGIDAVAYSVFVSGSDVYVAGIAKDKGGEVWKSDNWVVTVWKNGEAQFLTDASRRAIANSVYVSGDDVYVAGYVEESNGEVATLWVNGIAQTLPDGTNARSVFVSGSDVYVAGQRDVFVAKLWKNGIDQNLNVGNLGGSSASSVFVSGNDVYVIGEGSRDLLTTGSQSRLWKNGEMRTFAASQKVLGIFVVD